MWQFLVLQLDFSAELPCLLHMAMCSALCNESTLQYNPDKGNYEKIGESTEVALRVLAEKVCTFSLLVSPPVFEPPSLLQYTLIMCYL